jgi:hypothetical protein
MTATMRITPTKTVPMDSLRKTALVTGIFYLITFSGSGPLRPYSGPSPDRSLGA